MRQYDRGFFTLEQASDDARRIVEAALRERATKDRATAIADAWTANFPTDLKAAFKVGDTVVDRTNLRGTVTKINSKSLTADTAYGPTKFHAGNAGKFSRNEIEAQL